MTNSIYQANAIIASWIRSCVEHVELTTCVDVVNSFISEKKYNVTKIQADLIKSELQELISLQRIAIATKTTKSQQQRFPCCDEQQPNKIF
jgi:hypothetical protein